MSKPLTLRDREDKGDVDAGSRDSFSHERNSRFPSYFDDFCIFSRSLGLQMAAAFTRRRRHLKSNIDPATATMAIG
ncbi:MAG TPA: hypothetical protein VM717_12725 [Chthoniobacterales bacterium]|jgi:hypothetical protein|nr:hypothetical protein [Chthoniobacterales bacterium]